MLSVRVAGEILEGVGFDTVSPVVRVVFGDDEMTDSFSIQERKTEGH